MANEGLIGASYRVLKGDNLVEKAISGIKFDVTGTDHVHKTQQIGTSEEQLDFGEVVTPGYCLIVNRDATNYVELRPATGVADLIRMNAGEIALFRFADDCTAPFAIANTATCQVEYWLFET